jgi:hypothetical protein
MTGTLSLLCCENFRPEIEAAVAAEGWTDVTVGSFPARCGRPPLSWNELHPLLGPAGTGAVVIGNVCLAGLDKATGNAPPVKLVRQEQCFHMVAGRSLVDEAISRGAYLITPGWRADWRGKLRQMGFDEARAVVFPRFRARTGVVRPARLLMHRAGEMATRLACRAPASASASTPCVNGWGECWPSGARRRQSSAPPCASAITPAKSPITRRQWIFWAVCRS